MLAASAKATATVVTLLTAALNVCVGLRRKPPLRRASAVLARPSQAG